LILSGLEIKKQLNKNIFIEPYNEKQINPNSYNLRLADELWIYDTDILDMKIPNEKFKKIKIPDDGMILYPNKLYLGRTVEHTRTEKYVPAIDGRSSIGRLGLYIHVSAGFGDVGFSGYWTLEIFCIQPIKIYPNIEICQIYYHTIEGEYENYNSGKYQNNNGIQTSLLYKEFESN
jgi:dCTP deaminase